ncbi:hypothetical protein [Streptosporangium sp. NPDC006007]
MAQSDLCRTCRGYGTVYVLKSVRQAGGTVIVETRRPCPTCRPQADL